VSRRVPNGIARGGERGRWCLAGHQIRIKRAHHWRVTAESTFHRLQLFAERLRQLGCGQHIEVGKGAIVAVRRIARGKDARPQVFRAHVDEVVPIQNSVGPSTKPTLSPLAVRADKNETLLRLEAFEAHQCDLPVSPRGDLPSRKHEATSLPSAWASGRGGRTRLAPPTRTTIRAGLEDDRIPGSHIGCVG